VESNIIKIGSYQLENLLKNQLSFVYIDLRKERTTAKERWLKGSIALDSLAPEDVATFLKQKTRSPDHPLVLICEDGVNSMRVAAIAESEQYVNIFVVDGGVNSLP
jgi:rhodanese-related sulfurtransferase